MAAAVVNLFGILSDVEGEEDAAVVAEHVARKKKEAAAEREKKLREEAVAEDKEREKNGQFFPTREYLREYWASTSTASRVRYNGGRPRRYDGQNYGNGKGDYSGGRGRGRERGSRDQNAIQRTKKVNEVTNEKQEAVAEESGWDEVQQHQRKGSVPRDNNRPYQNGSRRFEGVRRDGYQNGRGRDGENYRSPDQSNASVAATEAQDTRDKAVAGGSDVVSEVGSVKDNTAVEQVSAGVDESPEAAKKEAARKAEEEKAAAHKAEEEEEAKKMTLEQYEKVLAEKKKALQALKVEERIVTLDKDLEAMQLVQKKKEEEIFVKLKSDKEKLKKTASLDKTEKKGKKVLDINVRFKPVETPRDGARRRAADGGDESVQGNFPRNGDGRRQDFAPRNGVERGTYGPNGSAPRQDFSSRNGNGRGTYGQNGGAPRQDFGPRNNDGRGSYSNNGGGRGKAAESADNNSQQRGRQNEAGRGRNGSTNNSYARPRGEGLSGRDISFEDPGQFPALGGSAAGKS